MKLTNNQKDYIRNNYKNFTTKELSEKLGCTIRDINIFFLF